MVHYWKNPHFQSIAFIVPPVPANRSLTLICGVWPIFRHSQHTKQRFFFLMPDHRCAEVIGTFKCLVIALNSRKQVLTSVITTYSVNLLFFNMNLLLDRRIHNVLLLV